MSAVSLHHPDVAFASEGHPTGALGRRTCGQGRYEAKGLVCRVRDDEITRGQEGLGDQDPVQASTPRLRSNEVVPQADHSLDVLDELKASLLTEVGPGGYRPRFARPGWSKDAQQPEVIQHGDGSRVGELDDGVNVEVELR